MLVFWLIIKELWRQWYLSHEHYPNCSICWNSLYIDIGNSGSGKKVWYDEDCFCVFCGVGPHFFEGVSLVGLFSVCPYILSIKVIFTKKKTTFVFSILQAFGAELFLYSYCYFACSSFRFSFSQVCSKKY